MLPAHALAMRRPTLWHSPSWWRVHSTHTNKIPKYTRQLPHPTYRGTQAHGCYSCTHLLQPHSFYSHTQLLQPPLCCCTAWAYAACLCTRSSSSVAQAHVCVCVCAAPVAEAWAHRTADRLSRVVVLPGTFTPAHPSHVAPFTPLTCGLSLTSHHGRALRS